MSKEQLKHLILEFLKYNGVKSKSEIFSNIQDVEEKDIQKCLYELVKLEKIKPLGANKNRTYILAKKK